MSQTCDMRAPRSTNHYRVTHLVANLGWVDLVSGSYLLPKQDGGTSQIKDNPTQVRHQMGHPVHYGGEYCDDFKAVFRMRCVNLHDP